MLTTTVLDSPSTSEIIRNRAANGEFAKGWGSNDFDGTLTDSVSSEVRALHSAFIDESPVNQEAAEIYTTVYPMNTADDFEDALFDTWDTLAEYESDLADPENRLNHMENEPVTLPKTGGVAVFTAPGALGY
jgi:hypothetical protein